MQELLVRALADIAGEVLTDRTRLGSTRLVLIDGPSGSGKSTLAGRLAAAFAADDRRPAVTLVHLDDLYEGWSGLQSDRGHGTVTQRLLRDLIEPLGAGRPGGWRRYSWARSSFAEWHAVPPPDILLLEGCGAIDPAFDDRAALTVWIEAPRALRTARWLDRDGEMMRAHRQAWQDDEDALYALRSSRKRADVLVDGDPTEPHDPDREVVLLDPWRSRP